MHKHHASLPRPVRHAGLDPRGKAASPERKERKGQGSDNREGKRSISIPSHPDVIVIMIPENRQPRAESRIRKMIGMFFFLDCCYPCGRGRQKEKEKGNCPSSPKPPGRRSLDRASCGCMVGNQVGERKLPQFGVLFSFQPIRAFSGREKESLCMHNY